MALALANISRSTRNILPLTLLVAVKSDLSETVIHQQMAAIFLFLHKTTAAVPCLRLCVSITTATSASGRVVPQVCCRLVTAVNLLRHQSGLEIAFRTPPFLM